MRNAAANLEFEEAARIRDEIRRLEGARARSCRARPPAPMSASISGACRTAACSAVCAPARAAGRRGAADARATLSEASPEFPQFPQFPLVIR